MEEKIVLTCTGGLDSTTLLYRYALNGVVIFPVFVDYGQAAARRCTVNIQHHIDVLRNKGLKIENLRVIPTDFPCFAKTPPLFTKGYRPRIWYAGEDPEWQDYPVDAKELLGWVEGRNLHILNLCAMYASSRKLSLYTGYTPSTNEKGDISEGFLTLFSQIARYAYLNATPVIHPLLDENATRGEVLAEAKRLGVDFTAIESCDYEPPCGLCQPCQRAKTEKGA